jgi:hypothetical protein
MLGYRPVATSQRRLSSGEYRSDGPRAMVMCEVTDTTRRKFNAVRGFCATRRHRRLAYVNPDDSQNGSCENEVSSADMSAGPDFAGCDIC